MQASRMPREVTGGISRLRHRCIPYCLNADSLRPEFSLHQFRIYLVDACLVTSGGEGGSNVICRFKTIRNQGKKVQTEP